MTFSTGNSGGFTDIYSRGQHPAESWKEILHAAFEECRNGGHPMVFIVHGWFTGDKEKNRDRWDVFVGFLDYLQANGAEFMTASALATR